MASNKKDRLVIGIGASAGGLEALEQFFAQVPADCGAVFVVVQHLDPDHKGILPELLQRITAMKVQQISDGVQVNAGGVYVIPPNKDLSMVNGKLHLLKPAMPRGLRLPIDSFFTSLAKDQRGNAVGVILSGMGADGALGMRAIKEHAGLVCVQTPESAKYDAMPRSVIDAGLVDVVATPSVLWARIAAKLGHQTTELAAIDDTVEQRKTQSALEQIIILLREHTGNDFSLYKKSTIYRRIERRMVLHQFEVIFDYVRYLRQNPQECELLFKELLIGVTNFFRDASVWEELKAQILPALLAEYALGKELRAWVPACSTGEEAYSLAMIFKEVLDQQQIQHRFRLQIFATDLDQDAIEQARRGFYPASISRDVSDERLTRFFVKEETGYRVNKEIREMVVFATQNIIMDPPFTKLDFLCCRNLLIYFGPELQKKLIPLFHYALVKQGVLLLGNAESINSFNALFATISNHSRLYRRIEQAPSSSNIDFPTKHFPASIMTQADNTTAKAHQNLQGCIDQLLLQNYAPAAVVVNRDGDILYINGRTGKYLEPAAGKANWNIHAMAREGLHLELASALLKAQQQTDAVFTPGLTVLLDSGVQTINLTVQAISQPEALAGMLIVIFNDVPTPLARRRSRKPANTEQQLLLAELQQVQQELQTLREERQTSQEELKSANEELQSTNEELQSTNEELTTSKEEMQSLNEELQTVNAELQAKVTDLSLVNNDMKNLLNSMEIATVFLDNTLNIRRFTSHATHLFKLIASDVGRPLSDIVTNLQYPELHQDAEDVLRTLVFVEKPVKNHDDRWFKVRIMPYRTQENVIDGVVITLLDITEAKQLEAQLRSAQSEKTHIEDY